MLMDDNAINNLRDALKFSPDNIPLRHHLAEMLLQTNRLDEAEAEYTELLKISPDDKTQKGLAKTFFMKEEYSKCNVILEGIVEAGNKEFDTLLLYTKALVKEEYFEKAVEIYKIINVLDPSFTDDELDAQLKMKPVAHREEDDEEEDGSAGSFIQKPKVSFEDVGGMDAVKKEIDLKIIKPLNHPDLYKAYGKKIGGGILLYGPPGCGKTYLAKATAGQVNAKFISVGLTDILDMWMGGSEKNLHDVFEKARQNTPCVLFFDEIDALGANRSDMKQSSGRHLINHFLHELDGVENDNEGILVLGATNAPWHLDPAFRRPGRFDRIIFVPPPDEEARESIVQLKLKDKPIEGIDYKQLAKKTDKFSGADLEAVIDLAIEEKLSASFDDGVLKPITTKDLLKARKKHKPTTQEWFSSAKNFALYANDSGLYDDILTYMKIKK